MREIDAHNVVDTLIEWGHLPVGVKALAAPLAWGVSNVVLRIEPDNQPHLVAKQSRPRLRTQIDWFSRRERIFREADVLRVISTILPAGVVPQVLFERRADFVLGLEAIRADHVVWKELLLKDQLDLSIASQLGEYLGTIHRSTAGQRDVLPDAADWSLFDELRIDPFYRWIARRNNELAGPVAALLEDMQRHRVCLVLADFSPKNVLIHPEGVTLVDFETGHYGDPAFDIGFFLSHVLLKSLRSPRIVEWRRLAAGFWNSYRDAVDAHRDALVDSGSTSSRSVRHLAACLVARIDGKSPVDYLPDDWQRGFVRRVGHRFLASPTATIEQALDAFFCEPRPESH